MHDTLFDMSQLCSLHQINFKFKEFIIFSCPFIICDLLYGCVDSECMTYKFTKNFVNLQLYLIMSALVQIIIIAFMFVSYCEVNKSAMFIKIFYYLLCGWTVIGTLIYFCSNGNSFCDKNIDTYMQASLILKLMFYSIKWHTYGTDDLIFKFNNNMSDIFIDASTEAIIDIENLSDSTNSTNSTNSINSENSAVLIKLPKFKFKVLCCVIIFFVACDFVFGFKNSDCFQTFIDKFAISIKQYLIICALGQLAIIMFSILSQLNTNLEKIVKLLFGFVYTWTVIGAIVFFDNTSTVCDNKIATYLYVSFVTKLFVYTMSSIFGMYN